MSINKAEQGLSDQLINSIKRMERQILEAKTHPQPIGGDVLKVVSSQNVSVSLTIAAGTSQVTAFSWTLPKPYLTLYAPLFTLYIDGITDNDSYPYGSNMTAGKLLMTFSTWLDYLFSNDTNGTREFNITIHNRDSVSHTYLIKHRLNFPILPLS